MLISFLGFQILKASVIEFILAILSLRNVKIGPTVETSNKQDEEAKSFVTLLIALKMIIVIC